MRMAFVIVISLASVLWAAPPLASAQERANSDVLGPLLKRADCDNGCLQKLMDQYLDALAAHYTKTSAIGGVR